MASISARHDHGITGRSGAVMMTAEAVNGQAVADRNGIPIRGGGGSGRSTRMIHQTVAARAEKEKVPGALKIVNVFFILAAPCLWGQYTGLGIRQ